MDNTSDYKYEFEKLNGHLFWVNRAKFKNYIDGTEYETVKKINVDFITTIYESTNKTTGVTTRTVQVSGEPFGTSLPTSSEEFFEAARKANSLFGF